MSEDFPIEMNTISQDRTESLEIKLVKIVGICRLICSQNPM